MAKFAAILLALSLAAGGALAASPETAYLAARDKYIAEIKALENSKASESSIQAAEDKAAGDLEKRLKDIVGPLAVKGFPSPDKLNLALSEHEEEFGNLDGLTSYSEGQDMVVTTKPLLRAWVEAKAARICRAASEPSMNLVWRARVGRPGRPGAGGLSPGNGRTLLLDLKRRGLSMAPKATVADGALGFWKAIGEDWPKIRDAGCIRPPTFSTSCLRASSPGPSACCKTSGWPKRGRTPRRRSTPSSTPTPSNTRRPPNA